MKKLFALVLTLALVFAIAAPAMALTWGATPAVTGSPFTVKVETYKVTSDALNPVVYAPLGNTAVVAATPVAFKITITVPTQEAAEDYYYDTTALTPYATVKLTNLVGVATAETALPAWITSASGSAIVVDQTKIVPGATATTLSATFKATVEKTDKALVEVEAGYKFTGALAAVRYDGYSFTETTVTKAPNTLTFTKTGDVVTGWSITTATGTYTIVSPTMFVQTLPALGAGTVLTTGADFEAVNTVYKAFAALLGFNVTTTGINFTEDNIIANYAAGGKTAAVGTYLPYTSSLTVTDGTAVPNTGDNMSVIGFVMVGLALLATAAVIVKKVRA